VDFSARAVVTKIHSVPMAQGIAVIWSLDACVTSLLSTDELSLSRASYYR